MSNFKIGDKIVCISSDGWDFLEVGKEYTVSLLHNIGISVEGLEGFIHFERRFKLVSV